MQEDETVVSSKIRVELERSDAADEIAAEIDMYDLEEECDASTCDEDTEFYEHVEVGLNLGLAMAEMRRIPEYSGAELKAFQVVPDPDGPRAFFFVARDEEDLLERLRGI